MEEDDPMPNSQTLTTATAIREPRVLTSEALLKDHAEIVINHHGERYRLRRTRQDKLILTK